MKEVCIYIQFPDRFTEDEIIKSVMGELDLKSYKDIGVRFYVNKEE